LIVEFGKVLDGLLIGRMLSGVRERVFQARPRFGAVGMNFMISILQF
jgi:hypothetical protein